MLNTCFLNTLATHKNKQMRNTALSHIHETLGAKMVPFAGYNMPVQYEGVTTEHETVRNDVGVFDVSHMGEFHLKGENALALIQKVCSNDASKLVDGQAQYSCLPNYDGGVVDDLIIYRISEQEYKNTSKEIQYFEPKIALIAGKRGLDFFEKISRISNKILSKDSICFLEIGNSQVESVIDLFDNNQINCLEIVKDLQKLNRVLVLKKS